MRQKVIPAELDWGRSSGRFWKSFQSAIFLSDFYARHDPHAACTKLRANERNIAITLGSPSSASRQKDTLVAAENFFPSIHQDVGYSDRREHSRYAPRERMGRQVAHCYL